MRKKREMQKFCGSLQQMVRSRLVTYQDGFAAGMRCIQVKSGELEYELMVDKCLDPSTISYQGINIGFLTKPGLQGGGFFDANKAEAPRSIMCGAMMTCGFENIHGHLSLEGKEYPTHGRMRSTPAEQFGTDCYWKEDSCTIQSHGEMRESEIFGENIVLRRMVETSYPIPAIHFRDQIENQGFREEPFCFLYHCNIGYPFLEPGCRMYLPDKKCMPRDFAAEEGISKWNLMEDPIDNAPEQVFLHELYGDSQGNTLGCVVNERLHLGYCVRFNLHQMPYLVEWKTIASGDYAWAMEPCNTGFGGRKEAEDFLEPGEIREHHLTIEILEGEEAIEKCRKEIGALAPTII